MVRERMDRQSFEINESPDKSSSYKFGKYFGPRSEQSEAPIGQLVSYSTRRLGKKREMCEQMSLSKHLEYKIRRLCKFLRGGKSLGCN